jgi:YD repeat-containing protein
MTAGNPINFGLGRKVQIETDYAAPGDSRLSFQRYYEVHVSATYVSSRIGRDWNHSFNRALFDGGNPASGVYSVGISEPNGHWTWFTQSGSAFVSMYSPADTLTKVDLGGGAFEWRRHKPNDDFEIYDSKGRNTHIESPGGRVLNLSYDSQSRLASVTNEYGRGLDFTYGTNGHLSRIDLPDDTALTYDYSTDSRPRLTTVHFPGGTTRIYGYDTASRLTGITDENGTAYLGITYHSYNKATATSLVGNMSRYAYTATYASGGPLSYGNEGATGVFDLVTPLGATVHFTTVNVNGSVRPATVSQSCPDCRVDGSAFTYDTNGSVLSRADFNTKKVCYSYDTSRNLETARAESIDAAEVCRSLLATLPPRRDVAQISTQWHSIWRLPTKIAEPNRVTKYAYNGDGGVYCAPAGALVSEHPIGVLCKKTVQGTTDTTGQQGLGASLTGTPRVWQYTYDQFGQVLTATDPNGKVTTTVYYATTDTDLGKRSNVKTITNAVGHITTFTAYDGDGRPLSITDPNGVVTSLTYWPRGWLHTQTIAGETTTYDYDGLGQPTKVTQPDGSYVQYIHDDAHRLTDIIDTLGNRIHYTLDAMGNRITEAAFEPGGYPNTPVRLKRQVYDSLNRLQQAVGAQ